MIAKLPQIQFTSNLDEPNIKSIFINPIDKYELADIIRQKLKSKYSAGYDDVPSVLIKKYFIYLLEPRTACLFN